MLNDLWSNLPMDIVYEILEFSNHAKLRNLVLMYKIPESDPRFQLQVKPVRKNKILFTLTNDKTMELLYYKGNIVSYICKIKNNIMQLLNIY
jgi:hypothetical protein